jgi:site-specific recombinase XerC
MQRITIRAWNQEQTKQQMSRPPGLWIRMRRHVALGLNNPAPMSDSELALVSVDSFATPAIIARASPSTRKNFFEFFTVPIRNANTRAAYYRAIQQFLAWAERAGYQDLEDIEPITVKQHMAAIRVLFSWLTENGVLVMNPAREVKIERFSRTEGKTPAKEVENQFGDFEIHSAIILGDKQG